MAECMNLRSSSIWPQTKCPFPYPTNTSAHCPNRPSSTCGPSFPSHKGHPFQNSHNPSLSTHHFCPRL